MEGFVSGAAPLTAEMANKVVERLNKPDLIFQNGIKSLKVQIK